MECFIHADAVLEWLPALQANLKGINRRKMTMIQFIKTIKEENIPRGEYIP